MEIPDVVRPRGEQHSKAKMTEEGVREMRRLHRKGFGYRRLARAFGVSMSTAQQIIRRRTWAHVA